jgi:hypothetical protein
VVIINIHNNIIYVFGIVIIKLIEDIKYIGWNKKIKLFRNLMLLYDIY